MSTALLAVRREAHPFSYFSGDGHILEDELVSDPAVARMCFAAFEAAWERSIPHAEYRPA